jgi:hypothetical protein
VVLPGCITNRDSRASFADEKYDARWTVILPEDKTKCSAARMPMETGSSETSESHAGGVNSAAD